MLNLFINAIWLLSFEHALHVEEELIRKHHVLIIRMLQMGKNVWLEKKKQNEIGGVLVFDHQVKCDQELSGLTPDVGAVSF